jgi:hypothetical protein
MARREHQAPTPTLEKSPNQNNATPPVNPSLEPLRKSNRLVSGARRAAASGYGRKRAASDSKSADERLDEVRQFTRSFHRDLVIALETNPTGRRERPSKVSHNLGGDERVAAPADNQAWHLQRLDAIRE